MFAMSWNQRIDMVNRFRIAVGSFIEEYSNKIQVSCLMMMMMMMMMISPSFYFVVAVVFPWRRL